MPPLKLQHSPPLSPAAFISPCSIKINLTPVSSIQEIDLWQNSETLADASPDERVTAAIHVLLSCLAKSDEDVVKLDKSLLDFHIDDLDQKNQ